MGAETGIEWTDSTWNPVRGCSRVSEGCRHCYAEGVAARFSGPGQPFEGFADRARTGSKWTGKMALRPEMLTQPLKWRRPRRIFVNSMSDLFHEGLTDGEILRVMMIIWQARHHTFQVLTKRPERMRAWFKAWNDVEEDDLEPKLARGPEAVRAAHRSGRARLFASMLESMGEPPPGCAFPTYDWQGGPRWWGKTPTRNVWLGVSVEDQATAEVRIPHLLATPAAVFFVSCEPLLGALDLRPWLRVFDRCAEETDPRSNGEGCIGCDGSGLGDCSAETRSRLDWIIAGGESGPGARPMHPEWVRGLRDQCAGAGVPFFFKQWGEWAPEPAEQHATADAAWAAHKARGGRDLALMPPDLVGMELVGKKAAGALLDGREHREFPHG